MKKQIKNIFLTLTLIILLGFLLRFLQLELKPMWIDEVLTALFSLGKNYNFIPINTLFSFNELNNTFSLNTSTTCSQISNNLINQSTHPPLFFCLMNYWLNLNQNNPHSLTWQLRSFSAFIGVLNIGAIYYLNRLAFSTKIGLISAAIMAVSPFAVYLSQEARHYSLPVFLITLALSALIKIQQELQQGKTVTKTWFFWVIINAISFYVHYFCLIAFIAQIGTIFFLIYRLKVKNYFLILAYCTLPIILFIPWFPTLIQHFNSPTAGWLSSPEHINPILQVIVAWTLMIIALPIENQNLLIQIFLGLITIGFTGFIVWQIKKNLSLKDNSLVTILIFISFVLLQFLVIVYGLQKDLTVAIRYNFIYYPAIVSLLAVTLTKKTQLTLILIGVISSIFVVNNLVFQKPYQPEIVAGHFNQSNAPLLIVLGYESSQEMALELSYLLELERISHHKSDTMFYFTERINNYQQTWDNLAQLSWSIFPKTVWFFTPHLRSENYPSSFQLGEHNICFFDAQNSYKLTFPYFYQRYNCSENPNLSSYDKILLK